ncbi:MAG: hypothetical protein RLZZ465_741 [Bacteroidota bacterium]|jgi:hypothetical protein
MMVDYWRGVEKWTAFVAFKKRMRHSQNSLACNRIFASVCLRKNYLTR